MKISVIGTGYVGLVQGVVFAEFGHDVICMDVDHIKIENLKRGLLPIYESGLEQRLRTNLEQGRLTFTTDSKYTVENSQLIFIAVGTPPKEDGSADLTYITNVAKNIGDYMNGYKVIVNKSTVPVGTGKFVKHTIQHQLNLRNKELSFDIVSNPEFLREGKALEDCMKPDRVVIGTENSRPIEYMNLAYSKLKSMDIPFLYTNIETSEMIKYATNAFLAVKISFINEMALLSEKVGANIDQIAQGMGLDSRINPKFLQAGPGYGGSCFPKDTRAIVEIAKKYDENLYVIEAAIRANEKQKSKMVSKIIKNMGSVEGKTIAVLGLSFKPETNDVREAPSLDIIRGLVKAGAKIRAFCPQGMEEARWRLEDIQNRIQYCSSANHATENANALVLITEWKEFGDVNFYKIKKQMIDDYFFDLRNQFARKDEITSLFKYYPVGNIAKAKKVKILNLPKKEKITLINKESYKAKVESGKWKAKTGDLSTSSR